MGGDLNFWMQYLQWGINYSHTYGFLIIFILMAVESSFIPFPSELVMIPAGFLAYRSVLSFQSPIIDFSAAVLLGMLGSVAGAFFNYYIALLLGRPFLYKYGKFFFIKPRLLERAEEIFREYGDIVTFVCRFLPAIRHLISIPAGLSKMSKIRFTIFTALGAGIWCLILTSLGYYLGRVSNNMSYKEIIIKGKYIIIQNYPWLFLGAAILFGLYLFIHLKIMKSKTPDI